MGLSAACAVLTAIGVLFHVPPLAAAAIAAVYFLALAPLAGDIAGGRLLLQVVDGSELPRAQPVVPGVRTGDDSFATTRFLIISGPPAVTIRVDDIRGVAVDRHPSGVDLTLALPDGIAVFRVEPSDHPDVASFLEALGQGLPPALVLTAARPLGPIATLLVLGTPLLVFAAAFRIAEDCVFPHVPAVAVAALVGASLFSGVPLAIAYTRRRVLLGIDGLRIENLLFKEKRELAAMSHELQPQQDRIVPERLHFLGRRRDGRVKRSSSLEFRSVADRDRFLARLHDLSRFQSADVGSVLARDCEDGPWIQRLARLASGAGGYREGALDGSTLVEALTARDRNVRVAAARILAPQETMRVRVREAAQASTDEEVRTCLEALATAPDDEARELALHRWVAGTPRK